ncbi:lytic polysaccharide mono-oxygenase [Paxillus involutus ATCC 200175]|uniref:lytic cellulose monooxygenase (C4-dehydrogenating) n=1 Tax=Paxillus involutus ATCC 200175 TaxID=664439 RepID=A0A0C9T048_PAXIN|nr:lytic polysaccharide mono-oxygenase [Paxillus involutus ATCC 200175]
MIAFTLLPLLLPALVSAHGYVGQVTIDGTVYKGNAVGTIPTIDSVIRQVYTQFPVKNASNPDLHCGMGAQFAKDVASANPGSKFEVLWVGGPNGSINWPHNTGPIMHYMAKCDGSCASYNSTNAEWFKISELGPRPDNQTWYQASLMAGFPANVTIPSTLAPGNYLLRSEIIALHLATTLGGAEFYPSCIQLSVGGSQIGAPTCSEEVTFPGGYSDTDPGILAPNIFDQPINYTCFPGPPVATFVSGSPTPGVKRPSKAMMQKRRLGNSH